MIPNNPLFTANDSARDSAGRKKRKVHPLWWVLQALIVIYFAVGFLLYYLQGWLLFHPKKMDRTEAWYFPYRFQESDVPYNATDTFNLVRFLTKTPPRGVVLYLHGNRENIGRYAPYTPLFTDAGYEVWMPDYPGFGKSTGTRSEALINLQAEIAFRLASKQVAAENIIVYGKSMGTGPASHVAAKFQVGKLILETPYTSIPDLMKRFAPIYPTKLLSQYQFPVLENVRRLPHTEILILHGTNDQLIPFSMAESIKAGIKPTDRLVGIPDGEHNNLADFPLFRSSIQAFLP